MSSETTGNLERDEVQEVIDYILAQGGHEITAEERKQAWYRDWLRSNLRILAYDDASIPIPNEEAELDKECGPVSMQLPGGITRPVQGP